MQTLRVDELQAAARALAAGEFRTGAGPERPDRGWPAATVDAGTVTSWTPPGEVLPVVGAGGATGATSLAVALAESTAPARVLECCSSSETGLAEASSTELGSEGGWEIGARATVRLSRVGSLVDRPADVPVPGPTTDPGVDVLDVGWPLSRVLADESWIAERVRRAPVVVVTAIATVPSLRRLELTLAGLPDVRVVAAVQGRRKRLSNEVKSAIGPMTRGVIEDGAWIDVPCEQAFAARGLTGEAPLPRPLLEAAKQIVRLAGVGATRSTTMKEHD